MLHENQNFIKWVSAERNTGSSSINTALQKLQAAARTTEERRIQNTFHDLHRVLCRAATPTAKRWAVKVDLVIGHVFAGHYVGTDNDARKMWNKRKYAIANISEKDDTEV